MFVEQKEREQTEIFEELESAKKEKFPKETEQIEKLNILQSFIETREKTLQQNLLDQDRNFKVLKNLSQKGVPHILHTYSMSSGSDKAIVQEYVEEGKTVENLFDFPLDNLSERQKLILLKEALELGQGLEKAGYVGNDLKPENFLVIKDLNGDFHLRYGDVGLTTENPHPFSGSFLFFSKDRLQGKAATTADDAYAIGQSFWKLFKGEYSSLSNLVNTIPGDTANDLKDHIMKAFKKTEESGTSSTDSEDEMYDEIADKGLKLVNDAQVGIVTDFDQAIQKFVDSSVSVSPKSDKFEIEPEIEYDHEKLAKDIEYFSGYRVGEIAVVAFDVENILETIDLLTEENPQPQKEEFNEQLKSYKTTFEEIQTALRENNFSSIDIETVKNLKDLDPPISDNDAVDGAYEISQLVKRLVKRLSAMHQVLQKINAKENVESLLWNLLDGNASTRLTYEEALSGVNKLLESHPK